MPARPLQFVVTYQELHDVCRQIIAHTRSEQYSFGGKGATLADEALRRVAAATDGGIGGHGLDIGAQHRSAAAARAILGYVVSETVNLTCCLFVHLWQ